MNGCLIDTLSGFVCTGTLAASTPTRPDGIFTTGKKFATAKQIQTAVSALDSDYAKQYKIINELSCLYEVDKEACVIMFMNFL